MLGALPYAVLLACTLMHLFMHRGHGRHDGLRERTDERGARLWPLGVALANAAVFIFFASSFAKPRTARDWRTFGAFSAFIVALARGGG